ncbi:response regulator [Alisedimentitalea sp. MJ-SS2]|uniref:response regulator n=1 Tax=Aliisedimentitalea sp. MJ-SS2 TaxID=3049795 RepID=UPI0029135F5B|nr:response regulator [Alisedimentitalea sp. MJ-SS2]MDU8927327.1 response regulator [Alisedimentitalea sp. MJ-SS2]
MDDLDLMAPRRHPTAARPLLGLTVLVVEDSRFTCEAVRLLCLRSGARIRRADCLASARRHLQVYRPSVMIIDLGLPDGSGTELIAELAAAHPRVGVILGMSGDDNTEQLALEAGADSFLAKPLSSLALFQETILSHLPADRQPTGPRMMNEDLVKPDPIALRDDLAHAAEMLGDGHDRDVLDYLAQFLGGIARSADDNQLEGAAIALARSCSHNRASRSDVARLAGLVQDRLATRVAI